MRKDISQLPLPRAHINKRMRNYIVTFELVRTPVHAREGENLGMGAMCVSVVRHMFAPLCSTATAVEKYGWV